MGISSVPASTFLLLHRKFPAFANDISPNHQNALNATYTKYVEMEPTVRINSASPEHRLTALNGWTDTKDPIYGAKVVIEPTVAEK